MAEAKAAPECLLCASPVALFPEIWQCNACHVSGRFDKPGTFTSNEDPHTLIDTRTWSPLIWHWERFKAANKIGTERYQRIPESFLREILAAQSSVRSNEVTEEQIETAALEFCRQYGRFLMVPSPLDEQTPAADREKEAQTIAGAEFWEAREDEFRKHDTAANTSLKAVWFSEGDHWKFSAGSGMGSPPSGAEHIFKSLARVAAKGLTGPLSTEPWVDWLNALRRAKDISAGKLLYSKISETGSMTLDEQALKRLTLLGESIPMGGLIEFVLPEEPADGNQTAGMPAAGTIKKQRFWDTRIEDIANLFTASANHCLDLRSRAAVQMRSMNALPRENSNATETENTLPSTGGSRLGQLGKSVPGGLDSNTTPLEGPDQTTLSPEAERSKKIMEAFKNIQQAEQTDPELRRERDWRLANLDKQYRRIGQGIPGPDSVRGAGNVIAAAYARDNPPPLLRSVKAARLLAMENLREEAKEAVQSVAPKTPHEVVECLWPAVFKYAKEVFDRGAEAKLSSGATSNRGKSYARWLRAKCLPAVIVDVCTMDAQFQITVRHVADAIVNKDPRTTWHALWGVLAKEFEPGSFMDSLTDRLRADLEVRSLYWEAQSIDGERKQSASRAKETTGPRKPAKQNAPASIKETKRQPHANPEAVLTGKTRVTVETASILLGVSKRRIRQLIEEEQLEAVGEGHARQISVSSIRRRLNLPINSEASGNIRK